MHQMSNDPDDQSDKEEEDDNYEPGQGIDEDDEGEDEDYKEEDEDEDDDDDDDDDDNDNDDDEDEDTDSEEDEEREKALREEIKVIQDALLDNPYDYDRQLRLITVAREAGDLELVRKARDSMAAKFPLTPDTWIEWIEDEQALIEDDDGRIAVIDLFERALKDYISIDIWLKYIYFITGSPGEKDALSKVRDLCERAISSVGLHVTEASSIWIAYRTFESGIIELIDPGERVNQYKKIFDLYRRQLAVPLLGMEETLQEFYAWCEKAKSQCPECDFDSKSIKYSYDQAYALLQKLNVYEQDLTSSDSPHYEEFIRYIEFEEANGGPPRVQCIYERALFENCLRPEIWIKYARYYDRKIQDLSLVTPIYERAIRNCPWSSEIWINYLRSLERNKVDHETILAVFERSLQAGFTTGKDYLDIWLTYLDYLRRKTTWEDDKQVELLRKNFVTAIEHLSNFSDGDINCELPLYMSKIEAKFIKNLGEARRIWNELIQSRKDLSSKAQTWVEYANFERTFGDETNYKKILMKGLNSNIDWPETLGAMLIKYVREEGNSINEVDEVLDFYEKVMIRATKRREELAKKAEKEASKGKTKASDTKDSRKRTAQNIQSTTETTITKKSKKENQDNVEFKVPALPGKTSVDLDGSKAKKFRLSSNAVKDEKILAEMKRQAEIKMKGDDEDRKLYTICVKNLKFTVDEGKLREVFSQFGEIVDIRLVRKYTGVSAGYGYIEFSTIKAVKEAVKHDRMPIDDRPVFIDEMGKKAGFKFSTSREANKLFVSNLAKSVTNDMLTKIFEKYGPLKDVRIATLRNGFSKGYAYIEFKDETSASAALQAHGLLVEDKPIKVQISDPSAKNKGRQFEGANESKILGAGLVNQPSTSGVTAKRRINVPLIPLAVRKKMGSVGKSTVSESNLKEPSEAMDTSSPSSSKDSM